MMSFNLWLIMYKCDIQFDGYFYEMQYPGLWLMDEKELGGAGADEGIPKAK